MKIKPKYYMLIAAFFLLCMFAFPIWSINLDAPQYPGGIGLKIWVNKITGAEPNDLQNINIMNHYIGMQKIEPDAIPELKYMPIIIIVMVVLAVLFAFINKWKLNAVWVFLFMILGIVALYDFYLWEYDYGHNLDSHAAIKIEGMAYQPPFIGSKQILNFVASSYPALGSLFMFLSMAIGGFAVWLGFKENKKVKLN
jgi:copper chaperone NosL